MAVPTIPSAIAATDIQTEFGGANPIAINEYYAGGTYVASGTANSTSVSIPTSGQIAYSNFSGAVGGAIISPAVQPYSYSDIATAPNAWARWLTNGACQYLNSAGATNTQFWLTGGFTASNYDVQYSKTGGTYSGTPVGMTSNVWYNLNANRTAYLTDVSAGGSRSVIATTLIKYNANSTVIDSNTGCTWFAWWDYAPCGTFCCFTPNTLITMADGSSRFIIDITVGDEIVTRTGIKTVTEVIERENMIVYKIVFDDLLELHATDDHPLFTDDKGWACIHPRGSYKENIFPHKLELGDRVLDESGEWRTITSMTEIFYPFKVYTLAESEFYANGLLVY